MRTWHILSIRPGAAFSLILLLAASATSPQVTESFREQQSRYSRVRVAANEKDEALRATFAQRKLSYPPKEILFRAFKQEAQLELWATDKAGSPYTLVHIYGICATSGVLGPKSRFGDEQVPEGFYELDWLNPQSNFFLSLHISYPNAADRVLGSRSNLGGDIFLHGNCVTIGCIPITDDGIKEVYWLAVLAHNEGQRHIPIEIFPARLAPQNLDALARTHPNQLGLIAFWTNLQQGFALFEKDHRALSVSVATDGKYKFKEEGGRVHLDAGQ